MTARWTPIERECAWSGCSERFMAKHARHLYHSARCRYHAKDAGDPRRQQESRARCAAWYAKRTENREERPWLLGAPPYPDLLPGGGFSLTFAPAPRWPLELRNARLIHGLVTSLTGVPHHETMPMFTLIPMNCVRSQWSVWIADEAVARRLAGHAWPGHIADQSVLVHCGPFTRLRTPQVTKRGHQRVRVDILTPLTIRSMGGAVTRVNPTEGNITSTLSSWLPRRLGVEGLRLQLRVIEKQTETVRVDLGGKFGQVLGCSGWFVADVNAPARWLLECAARGLGMGGRTAFGFGRIRVSDCAEEARAA